MRKKNLRENMVKNFFEMNFGRAFLKLLVSLSFAGWF